MTDKRVAIVIPAYNEEQTIIEVIRGLKQHGFERLIVVDDGSSDRTGELAHQEGVTLLRHILNRGPGGALGTGITAALRLGAEAIVTFDADGQHDPDDIAHLLEPITKGEAEVVIGSRMLGIRAAGRARLPIEAPLGHKGLKGGLKRRAQAPKLIQGQTGQIQRLKRAGLEVGEA
jgi:glycosyltransferase involved in cell wall biosynthesis